MKKLNNAKWFTLGIVITLLLSIGISALAANTTKTATLLYSDIKITLDGNALVPKDVNGNVVEPFIIDGTTYLPVRAVAGALGIDVDWDGATSTVKLMTASPALEKRSIIYYKEHPTIPDFGEFTGMVLIASYKNDEGYSYAYSVPTESVITEYVNLLTSIGFSFLSNSEVDGEIYKIYHKDDVGIGLGFLEGFYIVIIMDANSINTQSSGTFTLGAGEYVAGKDIASGKYDISLKNGSGNLFVYDANGRLSINEIFGLKSGQIMLYRNAQLENGSKITIRGDLFATFTPVV